MTHIRTITRVSMPGKGSIDPLEQIIILVIGIFFQDWDNYQAVLQNLQKFYSKT